jgi:hypothetical protein
MKKILFPLLLTIVFAFVLSACSATTDDHDMHSGGEHGAGEATMEKIPNDGRKIEILAPADGAIFKTEDSIVVEVATENFDLSVDGNHWHIFLNDNEVAMIYGDNNRALRGLEAGTYELKVTMTNIDHAEYEEGDSITITIEK